MVDRPEVFLSYATPDLAAAKALVSGLDEQGVACFFAPRDLGPGDNFAVEIVAAIAACEILVVLLSDAAVDSPHVRREVSLAVDERRTLVPLAMSGTSFPGSLPAEWSYWLSAVQVTRYAGAAAATEVVRALLRREGPAPDRRRPAPAPPTERRALRSSSGSTPLAATTPSAVLRAEARAVPVVGRDEELARLEAWAARDHLFGSRLLTGAAGQGKSRLAAELGERLERQGWEQRLVRTNDNVNETVAALGGAPSLLVVDYAETRVAQLIDLIESLAAQGVAAPVRLLLLARARSDWWARLTSASAVVDELLAGTEILALPPLTEDDDVVLELFRRAHRSFATIFGIPVNAVVRPDYGRFSSTLAVLEAALTDVLSRAPEARPGTARLAAGLLGHERRYVQAAADADGLDNLDATELDRCTGALTMFGAEDEASAVDLLRVVLPDVGASTLHRIARLYRRLYPGRERYLDGLRPDSLGEDLIVQLVEQDGGLPGGRGLWVSVSPGRLRHALSVVARAAARSPAVHKQLATVLEVGGDAIEVAAVDVATQLPDPTALVGLLHDRFATTDLDRDATVALLALIPDETIALAALAADLSAGQIAELPPPGHRNLADVRALLEASNRFSDAGRAPAAIEAVEEAVRELERLAETDLEAAEELGSARSNLSNRRWEAGRVVEALHASEEAVDALQVVGATGWRVAAAYHNLGFRLTEAGRFADAEVAAREAETRFEAAYREGSRTAEHALASARNNLTCLALARRAWAEGDRLGRDAVARRRRHAGDDRDRYLPYVARTLANGAAAAALSGDHTGAAAMRAEAVNLHALVAPRAPIFRYEQACGLIIGAVVQALSGDLPGASDTLDEADAVAARLPSGLGALRTRTLAILRWDRDRLAQEAAHGVRVSWEAPTDGADHADLLLPLLLEFKDL